jgi:hypothetical protein
MRIGMSQANEHKSIGYAIGKLDICQHKSLGKSATVFIWVTNNYRNWLLTYLIFSAIDIRLTNIQ